MAANKRIYLYGGAYDSTTEAMDDLKRVRDLYKQKHIGRYDSIAISKKADGSVEVLDIDATVRGSGARTGALAGGALMVLFPPSIIVGAAAGAIAGAVANDMNKRISRSDGEALAALLEPGEVGVLVVAEDIDDAYGGAILSRPKRQQVIQTEADADIVAEALAAGDFDPNR